ncbi:GNAT family N-acetyltransferase [Candidatus Aerophobetes bacterium]|nr:GNAT family N-acetyltransferase [Candidatus Aerophobetes bacterium]
MAYYIEIVNNVKEIPSYIWNSLVIASGGSIWSTYEWLRAYEESAPASVKAFHILVYSNQKLVGACPVYLTNECPTISGIYGAPDFEEPFFISHSFSAFYGYPLLLNDQDQHITSLIIDLLEKMAIENNAGAYGFVNIPEEKKTLISMLRAKGYKVSLIDMVSSMEITYSSYDEYLTTFRSNRRKYMRRVWKRNQAKGVRKIWDQAQMTTEDIHKLVLGTYASHQETIFFPPSYIKAIFKYLHPYLRPLLLETADGTPIACAISFEFNDVLSSWFGGADQKHIKEYEPFYYIYLSLIDYATKHRIKELCVGRRNYIFKSKFGFREHGVLLGLKPGNSVLALPLDGWCQRLEREAKERWKKVLQRGRR